MSWRKRLAIQYFRTKLALLGNLSKRIAADQAFRLFTTPPSRVTKELPIHFKKAEKLSFRFGGVPIAGYRWNAPQSKKILILHGFESSVVNFDKYIAPLVKKGYEVLAFDAPAHGRSGGKRIHAVEYKNFVLEILHRYGPITTFIAHSFGGLALSLALEELPHDESWRVVLIAPATESRTAAKQFYTLLKLDEGTQKEFESLITETNGKPLAWYSVARAAAQIRAQVLFLQDKQDRQTPFSDVAPIMEKNYPNFQFRITEGLGHRRIYKDENSLVAILNFL